MAAPSRIVCAQVMVRSQAIAPGLALLVAACGAGAKQSPAPRRGAEADEIDPASGAAPAAAPGPAWSQDVVEELLRTEVPDPPALPAIPEPGQRWRPERDPPPRGEAPETPAQPVARPREISASVVEVKPAGERSRITLSRGSADGIVAGMKGILLERSGARVPSGGFVIERTAEHESYAEVAIPIGRMPGGMRAVLRAP